MRDEELRILHNQHSHDDSESSSFLMTLIQDHLLLQIFLAIDILLLKVRLVEVEEIIAQLYES